MINVYSIIASVIGVAGAGFRLSLILNAVGVELATADVEIQSIARGISLFSLMLKQVGMTLEESSSLASQSALDTTREITNQSQLVFDEIKNMVEMVQKRDEKGHIRSITVAQRVKWCFKKQRVQYLLGQLESLKLSLSIMLQTLQLGKRIAGSQYVAQPHWRMLSLTVMQTRLVQASTRGEGHASRSGGNTEYGRCATLGAC